MRIAMTLLATMLLLSGCKIEAGTLTTTNYSISDVGVNSSRTRILDGNGEFECIDSVSGLCHFVLFTEDCNSTAQADSPQQHDSRACTARIVQAFSLKAGASKRVDHLPKHLQQCVDHQAAPTAPGCLHPTS
jgi:hypothetical protein